MQKSPYDFIGGYEWRLDFSQAAVILTLDSPNGWTNFGDPTNHLVGYITPLSAHPTGTAAPAHMRLLYPDHGETCWITMGPSESSSFGGSRPNPSPPIAIWNDRSTPDPAPASSIRRGRGTLP